MPATLQPLTTGQLLDRTFQLYRKNFVLFCGIAALPHAIYLMFGVFAASMPQFVSAADPGAGIGAMIGSVIILVAALFAYIFTIGLSQAAITLAVSDVYLDRPVTIGSAYRRTSRHFLRYLGIIMGVGLLVGIGIVLLIIPGIYFMVTYALSITVAAIENVGFGQATQRSKDLVKGSRGRIGVIFLLSFILAYTVTFALLIPATIAGVALSTTMPIIGAFITNLAQFISSSVVAPISLIAFTLAYYDARVRKEAFDLHLLMEQQQPALAESAAGGAV
jgi:hypothetical protein